MTADVNADVRAPLRVLVVCTGNSARSILAEALLRKHGGADFVVHSAGTDHSWARSKSVTEYLGQTFDYVITVCDQARQACPVFPGVHRTLHWGYEDPAAVEGSEEERLAAFRSTLTLMASRIQTFVTLARRERDEAATGARG
jgi:arsenate reductase